MTHTLMARDSSDLTFKATPAMQEVHARSIGPTLEREMKGDTIVTEETTRAGEKRKRIETQTNLDRYVKRGEISQTQYDAGDRLHRTFQAAGGLLKITSSYSIHLDNAAGDSLTRRVGAFERLEKAHRYVGNQLWPVVVAVCLRDDSAGDYARSQEKDPRSGLWVLRLGLDRLAEFYGRRK